MLAIFQLIKFQCRRHELDIALQMCSVIIRYLYYVASFPFDIYVLHYHNAVSVI